MISTASCDFSGLEKEYLQLKRTLFKKLFTYISLTNMVLVLLESLRAYSIGELDSLYSVAALLIFTSVLSKFVLNIKEKQDLVITLFIMVCSSAGLVAKYYEKVGFFANPLDSYYFGYNFCLFDRIVLSRIPTSQYRTVFSLCTMILKILVIPFNDKTLSVIHIIYIFSGIYLDLDKEKHDRNLFQSYFNSKNQLEKFKNLVVNDIPEGIVIISQDLGQCLFTNKSFSMLTGSGLNPDIRAQLTQFKVYEEEVITQSKEDALNMLPKKSLLSFVESKLLCSGFQTDQKFSCNVTYTKNQSDFHRKILLEVKVFHIVWDEVPAVAIIYHDITQQHTIINLKTANTHKDSLLATVSHELRTPLNGMMGMIQILQKKTQDPEFIKYLTICKNSGKLLMGLVNSILDLNQIRAKKLKLNPEKVNLHGFLKDMVQLFELQCSQKGLYLKLRISQSIQESLITDPNRLSQIFINLIGNALKFTLKGGITISAHESPDGNYLQLAVEDTGIGIKDEDKCKLFQMFGKLDHNNSQTNRQGVGLGLTISDNLARLLCGEESRGGINLSSCYGKGSAFSFWIKSQLFEDANQSDDYLSTTTADEDIERNIDDRMKEYALLRDKGPTFQRLFHSESRNDRRGLSQMIDKSKIKTEGCIKTESQHAKSEKYVLIVDDNPFNIIVAEYLIKSFGYKTKTALYGQTAIDLTLNNDHDGEPIKMIFMDCLMPIMDGYETTRLLRKHMQDGRIPEIPIIALTANNSEADKEASRKAGMWEHITKPLKETDLFKILNKYA